MWFRRIFPVVVMGLLAPEAAAQEPSAPDREGQVEQAVLAAPESMQACARAPTISSVSPMIPGRRVSTWRATTGASTTSWLSVAGCGRRGRTGARSWTHDTRRWIPAASPCRRGPRCTRSAPTPVRTTSTGGAQACRRIRSRSDGRGPRPSVPARREHALADASRNAVGSHHDRALGRQVAEEP